MKQKQQNTAATANDFADFVGDIGNFEIPDIDIALFDFMPEEAADTDNRYIKPRLIPMKPEQICFENAVQMARELKLGKGDRYDCIVSGSFIFGDFIEAFMVMNNCKAVKMVITTLSLSQENIDSLHTLLVKGYIDQLDMVVSDYFYSHERHDLIPYMYEQLDVNDRFQLAVAFVHTKTVHLQTLGGKKIVMHGSANLRTSGNVEQFTIEENPELYEFYDTRFAPVIERFKTINKTAPRKVQWADMSKQHFTNY